MPWLEFQVPILYNPSLFTSTTSNSKSVLNPWLSNLMTPVKPLISTCITYKGKKRENKKYTISPRKKNRSTFDRKKKGKKKIVKRFFFFSTLLFSCNLLNCIRAAMYRMRHSSTVLYRSSGCCPNRGVLWRTNGPRHKLKRFPSKRGQQTRYE